MSSEMALARSFFSLCKREIKEGGDYRHRLIFSPEFATLNALIPNALDIIAKAEAECDVVAFFEKEMGSRYRALREVEWGQRNFQWPLYHRVERARMEEAMVRVLEDMRREYPELAERMSDWAFRAAFVRSAYATDGAILEEWEKAYGPIKHIGRASA